MLELKLNAEQTKEVAEYGYVRLELDDALELLKPYNIGINKIAESLGMQRGNVRTQFSRGCMLDVFPDTGEIRMVKVEQIQKIGLL